MVRDTYLHFQGTRDRDVHQMTGRVELRLLKLVFSPSSGCPRKWLDTHTAIFNEHGEFIFTQEIPDCIRSEDVLSTRVTVLVSGRKAQHFILNLDVPHSQRTEDHHHGQ
jgi:hypothetical protein